VPGHNLRAVLGAARLGGDIDFREKIVFDGNGDPLHSSIPLILLLGPYDNPVVTSY
jgi:hypothetical protein